MSRTISTVKFRFPCEIIGIANITSHAQIHHVLDMFGRGIVSDSGVILAGVGAEHARLGNGCRFYFGRKNDTVYMVVKNEMDYDYIMSKLPMILSAIFDKYGFSVSGKLKFEA